jgi:AcrR family transcriptional regulator
MLEHPSKSVGRPRSDRSHRAMLQAAIDILAEVGLERLTIEAVAQRAKVGKSTIYRRYQSKEELVADALESMRAEIEIPDTGSLLGDVRELIESAAKTSLDLAGKNSIATIITSAIGNPNFAKIYRENYLAPRKQAFTIIIDRARDRREVNQDIDRDLIFDAMSGMMLYALIFPPDCESWTDYIDRMMKLLLKN